MKDEMGIGGPPEIEIEVEAPEKEESEESGGYETPEEAMEKALAESTPDEAIERLRHCGYELKKLEDDDAPVMGTNPQKLAADKRMAVASKAMAKFGLK